MVGDAPALTVNEALSGIFGSISLASWIFLLVPQLVENYVQSSASGISLAFLTVWFLGDITNLLGALWARLVPTVTALAVYFCFADTILITQCVYYNVKNARRQRADLLKNGIAEDEDADDNVTGVEEPLLGRLDSRDSSNMGLPGSQDRRRRRSSALSTVVEHDSLRSREWVKNTLSIIGVCVVGTAGWAIAYSTGVWVPTPSTGGADVDTGRALTFSTTEDATPLGAEILGYMSAVCYLGARIPQIIKNQRDRSCEGLSLLFFMLSLLGNATYGMGILAHSLDRPYVMTNLPWLIGSLGTIVEDATIFLQFRMFGEGHADGAAVEGAGR